MMDTKLKKCVAELFLKLLVYRPDQYKTQKMCDYAVDDSLVDLNVFPIGLLQVRLLNNFLILCMHMIIYSTLMKFLMISYFLVIL